MGINQFERNFSVESIAIKSYSLSKEVTNIFSYF